MNGPRVFLTGGTGFVGGHVLAELLRGSRRVRCLVRPGSESRLPDDDRVERVTGDLLSAEDCRRAAEGASAAIHLVGIIREAGDQTFQAVHVEGTRNVVEACRAEGVARLVHMSAHGASLESLAAYQRTKAAAERIVAESGLRWTVFRPSFILGPDGEFMQQMIGLVRPRWRPVPVLGDGQHLVQPLGVDETAALFVRALDLPAAERKIYGLGGPEPMTFNEFLDTLCRVVCGRRRRMVHVPMPLARTAAWLAEHLLARPPVTREQLVMLAEAREVDIAAAVRDFRWQPVPLETLVRQCVEGQRRSKP